MNSRYALFWLACSAIVSDAAWAIDTYDTASNRLTIPYVKVGDDIFHDISITVAAPITLHGSTAAAAYDTYDPASNRLSISTVRVGETNYTNVDVSVAQVLAIGGLAAVSEPQVTIYTDVTRNSYPASYTTASPQAAVDDPCLQDVATASYPASFLGTHPLPELPAGSTLKGLASLSISPKDAWVDPSPDINNPNINRGCPGDIKSAFLATMGRLKKLGASTITMYSSARLDNVRAPTTMGSLFIPDDDLVWIGQQAAANGLKVRFKMQVDVWDSIGQNATEYFDSLTRAEQEAWLTNYLRLYRELMLHEIGLMVQPPSSADNFEGLWVDWGYWWPTTIYDHKGLWLPALTQLAAELKAQFAGKLLINAFTIADGATTMLTEGARPLLDAVDAIEIMPMSTRPLTAEDNLNMTASSVKEAYNFVYEWVLTGEKPVIWTVLLQSQDHTLSQWVEDCCMNPDYATVTTDFGAQAIAIEGALEMIHAHASAGLPTDSVNIVSYWWTDNLFPHDSLPNISQSIRNKPAEAIVYAWWK